MSASGRDVEVHFGDDRDEYFWPYDAKRIRDNGYGVSVFGPNESTNGKLIEAIAELVRLAAIMKGIYTAPQIKQIRDLVRDIVTQPDFAERRELKFYDDNIEFAAEVDKGQSYTSLIFSFKGADVRESHIVVNTAFTSA